MAIEYINTPVLSKFKIGDNTYFVKDAELRALIEDYVKEEDMTQALAAKANLASPALTGVPTAPTAASGTATTQIATTAFVMMAMSASIHIKITPAHAGVTATATLADGSYSVQGVSDSQGDIYLAFHKYGKYKITYNDLRVKSLSTVELNDTVQRTIEAHWSDLITYTVRIDTTNSNPTTCCVYQDDAINMTKGSSTWDSMPIFSDIRPCVFNNGSVNYYLDKNDFTKKADGTNSDLTGADGDVMIEFWKFAYRIYKDGNYLYVSITNNFEVANADERYTYNAFSRITEGDLDMFYVGAFKGYVDSNNKLRSIAGVQPTANKNIQEFRAYAHNNGSELNDSDHYQQSTYSHLVALQCLYIIKYGSLDAQNTSGSNSAPLGRGIVGVTDDSSSNLSYVTGYNVAADDGVISGTMNSSTATFASGMCSGTTANGTTHVKFFGIEDFYGNIWEWVDGFWTDSTWQINTSWTSGTTGASGGVMQQVLLDPDGVDHDVTTFATGLTANASGWNKVVAGTSDAGFMPIQWGGSNSTYWADLGYLSASCVLLFGGGWAYGDYAGPFLLYANISAAFRNRDIGARLSYN